MAIDAYLLAQDLLNAKSSWGKALDIKRFPSEYEDILIVNPFWLYLRIGKRYWKAAIAYSEYPARSFPSVIFKTIPSCPIHSRFPHPNIDINSGFLTLKPSLVSSSKSYITLDETIRIIRGLMLNPVHHDGACGIFSQGTEVPQNVVILNQTTYITREISRREEKHIGLRDIIKAVGEVTATIGALTGIGKLVISVIRRVL